MISRRDVAAGVGVNLEQLELLSTEVQRGERHELFPIMKRGKQTREICRPDDTYDSVVTNLRAFLEDETSYAPPPWVYGFVRGRSTVQNAAQHLAQDVVVTMDLLRFFPTMSTEQVEAALVRDGLDSAAAELCGRLTTIGGRLPIGLSTSPHLSNLIFLETDLALDALARRDGLNFTRYVDDLTFSGASVPGLIEDVTETLHLHGWQVNPDKTRVVRRGGAQYVTGLYVGSPHGPFVPRRIKRRMRWTVHMIEQVGFDAYMTRFGGIERGESFAHLIGWARYFCAVESERGQGLLDALSAHRPSDEFYP